jgi:hypothetical protein
LTCSSIISSEKEEENEEVMECKGSESPIKFDRRISDIRAKLDSIKNKIEAGDSDDHATQEEDLI